MLSPRRLTLAGYDLAAAAIAMGIALVARLGSEAAGAMAERFLPLLVAGVVIRATIFVLVPDDPPSTAARRALVLVGMTAAGSLAYAFLLLGPLAPEARPGFPRAALAVEAVLHLGASAALLALPPEAIRHPSRSAALAIGMVVLLVAPMAGGPRWQTFDAPWPPHAIRAEYAGRVAEALDEWRDDPPSYVENLQAYDPRGPYFHYAEVWRRTDDESRFDRAGVPQVLVGSRYEYNPVATAQYVLAAHARFLEGRGALDAVRTGADALLRLQDAEGALRYDYAWGYYLADEPYAPGWVSGMAQGQAMSAFGRAYDVTGDERYLEAGRRALEFLMRPVAEGGTKSDLRFIGPGLRSRPFFEEYVSDPYAYTLNGYQFTLLGLYDWSQLDVEESARSLASAEFAEGVRSLAGLLPYYDIGGFSAYDLGHLTFPDRDPHVAARYHAVHVYLLHALHDITGEPAFARYERLWRSYVEGVRTP